MEIWRFVTANIAHKCAISAEELTKDGALGVLATQRMQRHGCDQTFAFSVRGGEIDLLKSYSNYANFVFVLGEAIYLCKVVYP